MRYVALGLSALACVACAHAHRPDPAMEQRAVDATTVELEPTDYDGFVVRGQLLIHAKTDAVIGRLIGFENVKLVDVRDCETGEIPADVMGGLYGAREGQSDVIHLAAGYWYGIDYVLPLFSNTLTPHGGPRCLELVLDWRPFATSMGPIGHRIHARVTRR